MTHRAQEYCAVSCIQRYIRHKCAAAKHTVSKHQIPNYFKYILSFPAICSYPNLCICFINPFYLYDEHMSNYCCFVPALFKENSIISFLKKANFYNKHMAIHHLVVNLVQQFISIMFLIYSHHTQQHLI